MISKTPLIESDQYRKAIYLFNGRRFFDAHEAWEDVWREAAEPDKTFLQGLIQIAGGLHHHSVGNLLGASSLLERGRRKLEGFPDQYAGLALAAFRDAVRGCGAALAEGKALPPTRLEPAGGDGTLTAFVIQPALNRETLGIPMLDLGRQYAQVRPEVLSAIERVCASQHFILGAEVESFERDAAAYLGVRHVVGCASGTDALWLTLMAAGVSSGDAVLTTPFSFFASASAIVRAGARPVFADIDPATLNLDPARAEARLKDAFPVRLAALLPVHLYGQCADMEAFARIGREFEVPVIEDAAQGFGACWRGRRAGALGLAGAFSFYPTKNLSAYGDGGAISTDDSALAERLRLLRNHGSRQRYYHEELGWNSRLDALQAAVLRVKLKHLDEWNRQRRARADFYDQLFRDAGLVSGPEAPLTLLATAAEAYHICHQYVIRARRRDDLRRHLSARHIGSEIYYPVPLHLQKPFAYLGYCAGDFPETERASREVLALPMFAELTEEEQRSVVAAIAEFYS